MAGLRSRFLQRDNQGDLWRRGVHRTLQGKLTNVKKAKPLKPRSTDLDPGKTKAVWLDLTLKTRKQALKALDDGKNVQARSPSARRMRPATWRPRSARSTSSSRNDPGAKPVGLNGTAASCGPSRYRAGSDDRPSQPPGCGSGARLVATWLPPWPANRMGKRKECELLVRATRRGGLRTLVFPPLISDFRVTTRFGICGGFRTSVDPVLARRAGGGGRVVTAPRAEETAARQPARRAGPSLFRGPPRPSRPVRSRRAAVVTAPSGFRVAARGMGTRGAGRRVGPPRPPSPSRS